MQPSLAPPVAFRFGLFEVDLRAAELRKRGRKVPLQDQPFKVLVLLLRSSGQVVTREDLQRELWPGDSFRDFDEGLNKAIQKLRQALDDSTDNPRFIETLPRKGYRFLVAIEAPAEPRMTDSVEGGGRRREVVAWALAVVTVFALIALATVQFRRRPSAASTIRFQIPFPEDAHLILRLQISPNGRYVLLSGDGTDGHGRIWVHSFDSMRTWLFLSTDDPTYPFWSPDSRYVAYFDGRNHLKKMDVRGGVPQEICDPTADYIGGGAWSRDGTILFSKSSGAQEHNSMFRVSASGGKISPVLPLDVSRREVNQTFPRFLPDGRHFLYQSFSGSVKPTERVDQASSTLSTAIFLASLDSKETRMLVASDSNADYMPGFLVYGRGGTLLAQPFDMNRLRMKGDAISVAEHVQRVNDQTSLFSAAADSDILVFGREEQTLNQLAWYERGGARLGSIGEPVRTVALSLAPDERRLAVQRWYPETFNADIWICELSTGIMTRLTRGADRTAPDADDFSPVWSPDGRELVFGSSRSRTRIDGGINLYRTAVGDGKLELLYASDGDWKSPRQWLTDGSLLFEMWNASQPGDFYRLPLSGEHKPAPLLKTDFRKNLPHVSADGRWIAYQSEESGRSEIYIAAFPTFKEKRQVSGGGGCQARWRKDGKELFYVTLDGKMMSVEVRHSANLETSAPRFLFQAPFRVKALGLNQYCVLGDGKKFIFAESTGLKDTFNVVLNWATGVGR